MKTRLLMTALLLTSLCGSTFAQRIAAYGDLRTITDPERGTVYYLKDKEQYPIKEWEEAVSYLLGCTVTFNSYEEITNSLKPFSLGLE